MNRIGERRLHRERATVSPVAERRGLATFGALYRRGLPHPFFPRSVRPWPEPEPLPVMSAIVTAGETPRLGAQPIR